MQLQRKKKKKKRKERKKKKVEGDLGNVEYSNTISAQAQTVQ